MAQNAPAQDRPAGNALEIDVRIDLHADTTVLYADTA